MYTKSQVYDGHFYIYLLNAEYFLNKLYYIYFASSFFKLFIHFMISILGPSLNGDIILSPAL